MKKTLFRLMALMTASAMMFAACEKSTPEEGGNGLKEDVEQSGNNGDNGGNGGNGGENQGGSDFSASLSGSAYVPIMLDAKSTEKVQDKIVANLSVDDVAIFLYVWEDTYAGSVCDGPAFYGSVVDWTSLTVGSKGWAGAGWCISDNAEVNPNYKPVPGFVSSMAEAKDWYFHFGYKNIRNTPQLMTLIWGGKEYKFAYGADYVEYSSSGDGSVVATHKAIAPTSGQFQVGVWNEYEICLLDTGIDFTKETIGNYLTINTEPTAGNTVDLDAMFFYKK